MIEKPVSKSQRLPIRLLELLRLFGRKVIALHREYAEATAGAIGKTSNR